MKYQASIECAVPPEKVFPFVAEPASRQAWMQKGFGSRYTKLTTEFPNGFDESTAVGTKFVDLISTTYNQAVTRYPGEILRYSKPTLFEFRTEVPYGPTYGNRTPSPTRSVTRVTFTLEPNGNGGTTVRWEMEDETVRSFGPLNLFFTPAIQLFMKWTLGAMKKMAEAA
jgi:uncharacterized protein YndB with AHSA1/START domain